MEGKGMMGKVGSTKGSGRMKGDPRVEGKGRRQCQKSAGNRHVAFE